MIIIIMMIISDTGSDSKCNQVRSRTAKQFQVLLTY